MTLADELAAILESEPEGLPLSALADRVHRREGDIREALRSDERFARTGSTRGRQWWLVVRRSLTGDGATRGPERDDLHAGRASESPA